MGHHRKRTYMYPVSVSPIPSQAAEASTFDWRGVMLRTCRGPDGGIWFVAQDVCEALSLTNTARALHRLDDDEKGITTVNTLRGPQSVSTVSEAGIYVLVFRSRKPEAKSFKRWVTHTVLPAVRRDGAYIQGEERLLAAATEAELQERLAELRASSDLALQAKERRGVCALEEREARATALKLMSRGRSTSRRR